MDLIDRMIEEGETPMPPDLDARMRIYLRERFGPPPVNAALREAMDAAITEWLDQLSEPDWKWAHEHLTKALPRVTLEDLVEMSCARRRSIIAGELASKAATGPSCRSASISRHQY
jgi:hypothetical protein